MSEFQRVELKFTATLMTNYGLDLDRDEIWDALNGALDGVNDGNFLVGTTELVTTGDYDES
jgi:hypothetical protein